MKNWRLGLAILAVPTLMFACKRTPAEKQTEVAEEMREEQRDHAKDTREVIKDEENPAERAEELREEQREHVEEMTDLQKEAFLTDANRELERLDKNIETLKNKAGTLTGEAKEQLSSRIEVLENKYDRVKQDIDDAKAKTGADLIKLRDSFEASLRELEKDYNDLAAKAG